MRPDSLAIETSTRIGSVSFGRGDQLLNTATLTQQRRHNLELMPAIAQHCDPGALREIYINVGPGSFTGLRIAVTTAKMLAMTLGVRVVAVEAVDVLAAQATEHEHLAVCVNQKRDTVYARLYHRGRPAGEAQLTTLGDLLKTAPRPLTILGHPLPDFDPSDDIAVLPPESAQPCSDALWKLGRERARRGEFADPATIGPRYARPPEAVTLWREKKKTTESQRTRRKA